MSVCSRKDGKWAAYRDGRVIITKKRTFFDTRNYVWRIYSRRIQLKLTRSVTKYGKTFLPLVVDMDLCYTIVCHNDLRSDALTYWNPEGGASTINYLMGSPSLLPENKFHGLVVDHAYPCFKVNPLDLYTQDEVGHVNYQLTQHYIVDRAAQTLFISQNLRQANMHTNVWIG